MHSPKQMMKKNEARHQAINHAQHSNVLHGKSDLKPNNTMSKAPQPSADPDSYPDLSPAG